MAYLFANNAKSTLAAPITNTSTSLTLSAGSGSLFPNPTGGDFFTLTLTDAATGQVYEITHCTTRVGDVCTVVRAQEGTTALNWTTGDFANNFITAETAAELQSGAGNISVAIAGLASTLRRSINAYRPEPNSENRSLAYAVFNAAKVTNTDGALTMWEPDGVAAFGSVATRDQAFMIEAYLEYFTPAEVSAIATYILGKCNLGTGEVPNNIDLDGTVHFKPGPTHAWGARAPIDGNFYLLQIFWLHFVMTGSASLYSAHATALKGLIESGVNYNVTTQCVNIDNATPYVGFGFLDVPTLTGDVLMPSILAVRAFQMAAEMELSLFNAGEAARMLSRSELIKTGINQTLVVRSAGSGGQLSDPYNAREIAYGELATNKGINQIDLWATAYLVWCDIVSPDDAKRIANYLFYTIASSADNYVRGGLRNIVASTDYNPGTACYQATWASAPTYGQGQNGGFWPTPNAWLQFALNQVQPEAARGCALDLYTYAREQANSVDQWWSAAGAFGTGKCLVNTANLLMSGDVDGPVLVVDEWSGVIRTVANETLKLILNSGFDGTILSTTTISATGTATATFKINTTALGGTANAVSTTEQTQQQASVNRFAIGDDVSVTVSSSAGCTDLYFTIKYLRRAS